MGEANCVPSWDEQRPTVPEKMSSPVKTEVSVEVRDKCLLGQHICTKGRTVIINTQERTLSPTRVPPCGPNITQDKSLSAQDTQLNILPFSPLKVMAVIRPVGLCPSA